MTIFLIILGFLIGLPAVFFSVKAFWGLIGYLIVVFIPNVEWSTKLCGLIGNLIVLAVGITLIWVIIQFDLIPAFIQVLNKK